MGSERIIQLADLTRIAENLSAIHSKIETVNNNVAVVDNHVDTVENELHGLKNDFNAFVKYQILSNRKQVAETRLVKIRQELDKKFGHYDIVRRTTTGILQATDLQLVRKEIISNATEEMMISTPGYWLAPCLVALAAWISDQQDLAERAVKEAISRDDEKTSLFFSLVSRRADRKLACMKWVNRYLMGQNEEALDRKTILVLSAYANGLWGADAEGAVVKRIKMWLDNLEAKPGVIDKQRNQWKSAISLLRPQTSADSRYPYLVKYSPTWPELNKVLTGAYLHENVKSHFNRIFAAEGSNAKLIAQLDEILTSLVTDFDDEELPLRESEQLEQFVIDFDGDEDEAKKHMQVAKSAFDQKKDFIQLLTDASMNAKTSHADIATQKFAIALSKERIKDAYRDIIAKNRSNVPSMINFAIEDFQAATKDGKNEEPLLREYNRHIEEKRREVAKEKEFSSFEKACKYIRIVTGILGVLFIFGAPFVGIALLGAAFFAHLKYNSRKSAYEQAVRNLESLEERRESGKAIIRAILAETVDFRKEFSNKDQECNEVMDFIDGLNVNQFVNHNADTPRRVMV